MVTTRKEHSTLALISKRTIDALISEGKPATIRDEGLSGFGARLNANGSVSYVVEYRAGRGRGFPVKRMVLGKHGTLTPDQARTLAKQTLARVTGGADPAGDRSARRREMTVADLLRSAVETHWKPKRKTSTAANFAGMIERTLIPEFGAKRLSELKRVDIRSWHARQTNRPRQANLDLAILRKALALAVNDELIPDNPARGITPHPENRRDRVPSDDELRALLSAIAEAPIRPQARLLVQLLMLTGCRTAEWRTAEWGWLDFQSAMLQLPDAAAKAGARNVPLSSAVMALLAEAPRDSHFVIPNDTGQGPLEPWSVRAAWKMICKQAKIEDLHVHDLRHAFATRGARLGASATLLRDALGHKTLAMTSRYVTTQHDPVRALADQIGAEIAAIGKGASGEVVGFPNSGVPKTP